MKVYFKTVGCRVNQVESESLRARFAALGHCAAATPEEADLVVVNTCSVTARADRDCLAFLKKTAAANPAAAIAVTGCLATLEPKKILAAVPKASVFTNADKEKIPSLVCGAPPKEDFFSVEGFKGRARAFVKVQEGCDLKCSYCLVNLARNKMSSKPLKSAVSEIEKLVSAGFAEIVLCGTRLGIYRCPETGADLAALVSELFALPGSFRVRFSSIEPGEINAPLLRALAAAGGRFCDYFHIPLQSGSDAVLRAMGRNYDTTYYRGRLEEIRSFFPSAGLYADIIAGYPSETEKEFGESLEFVRSCGLSGLHVFSFSARPGTRAAALKPLPPATVKRRSAALRALDLELRSAFAASMLGRELEVLSLSSKAGRSRALASNFLEVDIPAAPVGRLLRCRVTAARGGACSGEAL
ncbi:MAG: MiaB family RNA modification protein [Elusimicrobia bacterium]|nr:MAG: MiaB family RNA modification protein [Elusimicrobiota bacterium]KAF0158187.1 MAG: MiaB family RNA modification protein [Elusimicrobiota bacterium]